MAQPCGGCRWLRLGLGCALGGGLAGGLAYSIGLNNQATMLATFAGAYLPLLLYWRRKQTKPEADPKDWL